MAFILAPFVKESSTTTGTGDIELNGIVLDGRQTFVDAIGDSNTTDYYIYEVNSVGKPIGEWESGTGTINSGSPDTLSRDTIHLSSNSNQAVDFGSGTKHVVCFPRSDKLASDASNLSDLDDTSINSPTSGEALVYDGSNWSNQDVATQSELDTHTGDTSNPHSVTAAQVGASPTGHNHPASDITSGTFSDARIAESNVTQHQSSIDHDSLNNFNSNEHINHTSVNITGGQGLSGGGDITSNRTLNVDITNQTSVTAASLDEILIEDASDSFNTKKVTAQSIADLSTTSPGGSDTQLQYNNSGSFAGASGITTDGSNLNLNNNNIDNVASIDGGGDAVQFDDDIDMQSNDIVTSGTIDGRDVSADGSTLDSHTSNTSNPHSTTLEQARSQNNTLSGDLDLGDNNITDVAIIHGGGDPVIFNDDIEFTESGTPTEGIVWYTGSIPEDIRHFKSSVQGEGQFRDGSLWRSWGNLNVVLDTDNNDTSSRRFTVWADGVDPDNASERFRVLESGSTSIFNSDSSGVGLTVQSASSQSANLTEWQDSGGDVLAAVVPLGQPDSLMFGTKSSINLGGGEHTIVGRNITNDANSSEGGTTIIGANATNTGAARKNTLIGANTFANHRDNVVIGYNASSGDNDTFGFRNVVIGSGAKADTAGAIAIGEGASVSGDGLAVIGGRATADVLGGQAMGDRVNTEKVGDNVFGYGLRTGIGQDVAPNIRLQGAITNNGNVGKNTFSIETDWLTSDNSNRQSRARFDVYDATSSREFLRGETDGTHPFVGLGGTIDSGAFTTIHTPATDHTNLLVKAISSQTANLTEWQDDSGQVLSAFNSNGIPQIKLDDSGGTNRMLSEWTSEFVDSTAASFKTRGLLKSNDFNAEREALRWEADGSRSIVQLSENGDLTNPGLATTGLSDTGIVWGLGGGNDISLTAGGVEGMRVVESGGDATVDMSSIGGDLIPPSPNSNDLVIGSGAKSSSTRNVTIGVDADNQGANGVAIGFEATGNSNSATAVGRGATAGLNATAIGDLASATAQGACALGSGTSISEAVLGYGFTQNTSATATGFVLQGSDAGGGNARDMYRLILEWLDDTSASRRSKTSFQTHSYNGQHNTAYDLAVDHSGSPEGHRCLHVSTADPDDAGEQPNDSLSFYINGSGNLVVKRKDGGGTVTTGTITLN